MGKLGSLTRNKTRGGGRGSRSTVNEVRVAKSIHRSLLRKRLVSIASLSVAALVFIYLCFAATIMRVVPTATPLGAVPVKNMVYQGGRIPSGQTILADTERELKDGPLDMLMQAFVPSASSVLLRVEAGPYGKVSGVPGGLVTVDGAPLGGTLEKFPSRGYLRDQYVGQCVGGACAPGEYLIIKHNGVYGQPLLKEK